MAARIAAWFCVLAMVTAGCSSSDKGENGDGAPPKIKIPGIIEGAPEGTLTYTPPEGWKAMKQEGQPSGYLSVMVCPDKPGQKAKFSANITLVEVGNILLPKGLEGWADKHIDSAKTFRKDVKIASNKAVKLGKHDAREIVFTWKIAEEADFTVKTKVWLVQGKEDSYSLTAQADTETFAAQEAAIDAAAQSIAFK